MRVLRYLLGLGIVGWGVAEAILVDDPTPFAFRLAFVLAATVPVLVSDRLPLLVIGVTLVSFPLNQVLEIIPLTEAVTPAQMLPVAAFVAARRVTPPARAGLLGAALAVTSLVTVATWDPAPGEYVFTLAILGAPWTVGWAARRRDADRRLAAAAHAEALRVQREQVAAAVALERRTIARELHDIVAQSVAAIAERAADADELLDRSPQEASRALRTIQDTSREALDEMRRLLAVLRPAEEAALSPSPTATMLADLVRGTTIALRNDAEHTSLPDGPSLAIYRIVEDVLDEPRAGQVTQIDVGTRQGCVDVRLQVRGAPLPELLGRLRERARLHGGDLESSGDGERWAVHARLPIEERS